GDRIVRRHSSDDARSLRHGVEPDPRSPPHHSATTGRRTATLTVMARILVADDSPSVRLLVRRHLQADGHEILEAEDGDAAYALGAENPDLAILDQLMPGMRGTDVLHRWRADERSFP